MNTAEVSSLYMWSDLFVWCAGNVHTLDSTYLIDMSPILLL